VHLTNPTLCMQLLGLQQTLYKLVRVFSLVPLSYQRNLIT
jgi:hypothetical protein